jgi:hypothetical protein
MALLHYRDNLDYSALYGTRDSNNKGLPLIESLRGTIIGRWRRQDIRVLEITFRLKFCVPHGGPFFLVRWPYIELLDGGLWQNEIRSFVQ